MEIVSNLGR